MKNLILKFDMNLYYLKRDDFVSYLEKGLCNIEFVSITEELLSDNKILFQKKYRLWKRNLRKGAVGLFALVDGIIVGYGWLKKKNSVDSFYRFDNNIAYLSEFFVDSEFRGKNIYPMLLSKLITVHSEYEGFFISAYQSNTVSVKGLLKVGFKHIQSLRFFRVLKITLNKYKIISDNGRK